MNEKGGTKHERKWVRRREDRGGKCERLRVRGKQKVRYIYIERVKGLYREDRASKRNEEFFNFLLLFITPSLPQANSSSSSLSILLFLLYLSLLHSLFLVRLFSYLSSSFYSFSFILSHLSISVSVFPPLSFQLSLQSTPSRCLCFLLTFHLLSLGL